MSRGPAVADPGSLPWRQVAAVAVEFDTHHPQGMAKIDDCWYVSSVEVKRPAALLPVGARRGAEGEWHRRLALGGWEIFDPARELPVHQVPVELRTGSGLPMTQNPFWVEATAQGLRAFFLPEDRRSTIYVFEAQTGG